MKMANLICLCCFQDGGEVTKPLLAGTLPASCQLATVSVGDHGLQMGNLQYYPKLLKETQVRAHRLPLPPFMLKRFITVEINLQFVGCFHFIPFFLQLNEICISSVVFTSFHFSCFDAGRPWIFKMAQILNGQLNMICIHACFLLLR